MADHVYKKCTDQPCEVCFGTGYALPNPDNPLEDPGTCFLCHGRGHYGCSGCRGEGMDCTYEALSICAVCGGMEGSLLPFCPERQLTADEDAAAYAQYCQGTGPFAEPSLNNLRAVLDATSAMGGRTYEAVMELWLFRVEQERDLAGLN